MKLSGGGGSAEGVQLGKGWMLYTLECLVFVVGG